MAASFLCGHGLYLTAQAVNEDGSAIVGASYSAANVGRAFLWTSTLGMVDLNVYLPALGVDLTGWILSDANGISSDGSTIVGTGTFDGLNRGWVVAGVPAPTSTMTLSLLGLSAARRREHCKKRSDQSPADDRLEYRHPSCFAAASTGRAPPERLAVAGCDIVGIRSRMPDTRCVFITCNRYSQKAPDRDSPRDRHSG